MKRFNGILLLLSLFVITIGLGQYKTIRQDGFGFYGHLNTTCIGYNGGTVYLQIEVNTPVIQTDDRKPMNIAVVLDRSGSMTEDRKITYAKKAINSLIDQLTSNDYLSIVVYDNRVDVLASRQRVQNRQYLKNLVDNIYPRGSTNLGGGMIEGFHQIERYADREFVNRVILISDGLANQGITDPYELNRIASQYRSKSISLTTMGVGLDYNENLMLGLANQGGGNYYYIESPSQIAGMFNQELKGLTTVVAQNASIELSFGSGVTLADVIGCQWQNNQRNYTIQLGDLYSNEHRELTVELNIPEGTGTKHVAKGVLNFESRYARLYTQPKFSVDIHYSNATAEIDKGKDWDIQGKVDVALSTRKVEQAMQSLDAGNQQEAVQRMDEAKMHLRGARAMTNSAVAAPMLDAQMSQLNAFSKELTDTSKDAREKKKSIQFKNYKTQKRNK